MPTGKASKHTRKLKRRVTKVNHRRLNHNLKPLPLRSFTRAGRKRSREEANHGQSNDDRQSQKRLKRADDAEHKTDTPFGMGVEPSDKEEMISDFLQTMHESESEEDESDLSDGDQNAMDSAASANRFGSVIDQKLPSKEILSKEAEDLQSQIEEHQRTLAEMERSDPVFFAQIKQSGDSDLTKFDDGVNLLDSSQSIDGALRKMQQDRMAGMDSHFTDDVDFGDEDDSSDEEEGSDPPKVYDDIKLADLSDDDDDDNDDPLKSAGLAHGEDEEDFFDMGSVDGESDDDGEQEEKDRQRRIAQRSPMNPSTLEKMCSKARSLPTMANLKPIMFAFCHCIRLSIETRKSAEERARSHANNQKANAGRRRRRKNQRADADSNETLEAMHQRLEEEGSGMDNNSTDKVFSLSSSPVFKIALKFCLLELSDLLMVALQLVRNRSELSRMKKEEQKRMEEDYNNDDSKSQTDNGRGNTCSIINGQKKGMDILRSDDSVFKRNSRLIQHYLISMNLFWQTFVIEEGMNRAILQHLKSIAIIICVSGLRAERELTKYACKLWCSGQVLTRVDAFLYLYEMCVVYSSNGSETKMARMYKLLYSSFVTVAKRVSVHSLSGLNFLMNCLTQIYLINPVMSYKDVFHRLRSVAFHVKNAVRVMSNQSGKPGQKVTDGTRAKLSNKSWKIQQRLRSKERIIDSIYNWRMLNVLRLWGKVLCAHASITLESDLHLLFYPFTQICLTVLNLSRSAMFDPFRLHILTILCELVGECSKCTTQGHQIFVPLIPHVLGVLDNPAFTKKSKPAPIEDIYSLKDDGSDDNDSKNDKSDESEDSQSDMDSEDDNDDDDHKPEHKKHQSPKQKSLKVRTFDESLQTVMKVGDKYFGTHELHRSLVLHSCRILSQFLDHFSYHIGFVELCFPAQVFLQTMCAKSDLPLPLKKYPRILIRKIRENADWILVKRRALDFGPMDTAKCDQFLSIQHKKKQSPMSQFVRSDDFQALMDVCNRVSAIRDRSEVMKGRKRAAAAMKGGSKPNKNMSGPMKGSRTQRKKERKMNQRRELVREAKRIQREKSRNDRRRKNKANFKKGEITVTSDLVLSDED